MKLSQWMAEAGHDDEAVAKLVGIDRATISRIRRGLNRPSWDLAAKLKLVSDGAVTADDHLPTDTTLPEAANS